MPKPWVKWLINHDMKFVLYIVWLVILPLFLLVYLKKSADDALYELNYIKNAKKGNL
jgi:hypothetical protein